MFVAQADFLTSLRDDARHQRCVMLEPVPGAGEFAAAGQAGEQSLAQLLFQTADGCAAG